VDCGIIGSPEPQEVVNGPQQPSIPLTDKTVGLCERCRHARRITSSRGSTFYLCGLSERDPRFPKYPRLPVLQCAGFSEIAPTVAE